MPRVGKFFQKKTLKEFKNKNEFAVKKLSINTISQPVSSGSTTSEKYKYWNSKKYVFERISKKKMEKKVKESYFVRTFQKMNYEEILSQILIEPSKTTSTGSQGMFIFQEDDGKKGILKEPGITGQKFYFLELPPSIIQIQETDLIYHFQTIRSDELGHHIWYENDRGIYVEAIYYRPIYAGIESTPSVQYVRREMGTSNQEIYEKLIDV
jgi:hypothetical protein